MIRTASPQEVLWDGFAQSGNVHSGFHARDLPAETQLFPENCQFRASIKRMMTEEDACESTKIRRGLSMVDVKDVRQALDVLSLGGPQKKRRTFDEGLAATSIPGCTNTAEIVDLDFEFEDGLRRKRNSEIERGSTLLDNNAFAEKVSSCAKVELLSSHVDRCKGAFLHPDPPQAHSQACTALILYQPKERVVSEGLRRAARRSSHGGCASCNGFSSTDCLACNGRTWVMQEEEPMGAVGAVGTVETEMADEPAQGSALLGAQGEWMQMEGGGVTGPPYSSSHAPHPVYDGDPWQLPGIPPLPPPRPASAPSPAAFRPPPLAACNKDLPPLSPSPGLWPTPQLNPALWPAQELPARWPNGGQAQL
mmetsp:Transcript_53451/g.126446  ORF Transcript_53451/g.126446 Transcript_53451/m.126446 type:complete len:365 (+) Transcript_53451:75-1169(+)